MADQEVIDSKTPLSVVVSEKVDELEGLKAKLESHKEEERSARNNVTFVQNQVDKCERELAALLADRMSGVAQRLASGSVPMQGRRVPSYREVTGKEE